MQSRCTERPASKLTIGTGGRGAPVVIPPALLRDATRSADHDLNIALASFATRRRAGDNDVLASVSI